MCLVPQWVHERLKSMPDLPRVGTNLERTVPREVRQQVKSLWGGGLAQPGSWLEWPLEMDGTWWAVKLPGALCLLPLQYHSPLRPN